MKKTQLYILSFCLISCLSFGQTTKDYTDFQTWYGASVKLDLAHQWAVTAQYRMRLIDDASYYRGSYLYGEVDKGLNNTFSLKGSYRLAMVDEGTFQRYAFGIEAKKAIKNFSFTLRPMIQYQSQTFEGDDEQTDSDTYLRTRLTGKYKLTRKLDVYAYTEPFIKLENGQALDKFRNSAGLKYEVFKDFKVNLFYIWQPDYSKKHVHNYHIAGLDLEFTLKPWKSKK